MVEASEEEAKDIVRLPEEQGEKLILLAHCTRVWCQFIGGTEV